MNHLIMAMCGVAAVQFASIVSVPGSEDDRIGGQPAALTETSRKEIYVAKLFDHLEKVVDPKEFNKLQSMLNSLSADHDYQLDDVMRSLGSDGGIAYTWPGDGATVQDRRLLYAAAIVFLRIGDVGLLERVYLLAPTLHDLPLHDLINAHGNVDLHSVKELLEKRLLVRFAASLTAIVGAPPPYGDRSPFNERKERSYLVGEFLALKNIYIHLDETLFSSLLQESVLKSINLCVALNLDPNDFYGNVSSFSEDILKSDFIEREVVRSVIPKANPLWEKVRKALE